MKFRMAVMSLLLLSMLVLPAQIGAQEQQEQIEVLGNDIEIVSGERAYQSYLAAPADGGPYPAVILIHSFRGLEEGYRTMTDQLAAEGFVVLAVGWQTFEQSPADEVVMQLVEDSITFLSERGDVDPDRIGLTGFCAGGRYTMLFLSQIDTLQAGVAWYGFPEQGSPAPIDLVDQLTAPMLIIHGTADDPSPIADIYEYATALDASSAPFELKVYSGEPHGFMLENGQMRDDEIAQDAFRQMADFFKRKLV